MSAQMLNFSLSVLFPVTTFASVNGYINFFSYDNENKNISSLNDDMFSNDNESDDDESDDDESDDDESDDDENKEDWFEEEDEDTDTEV